MRYILFVELEGFYVDRQSVGSPSPVAVVRDKRVLDVNRASARLGVVPGLELRTARAIAPGIEFVEWKEEAHIEAQKRWLDLCTLYTGVLEPDDQHCAFLDLGGHPNPYEVSERLIRSLASETGLAVNFGAAGTKWVARLAARMGEGGLALSSPARFLSELPVSRLEPIPEAHRERLQFLGYSTIGQLTDIPFQVLNRQFGPEGLRIVKAARGEIFQAVQAHYPRDSLLDSLVFEGNVDSLETLDLALKELAGRFSRRLNAKGMHAQVMAMDIEYDSADIDRCKRRFSKPVYNFASTLSALRLLLREGLKPQPVSSLRIALNDLSVNQEQQKTLFSAAKRADGSAFQQVRTAFGNQSVQLGSSLPVPRRVLVLREWKNATGWS